MADPELVRIGTRGSPLALYQARLIAQLLETSANHKLKAEIVTFTTKGDQLTTERLINSGGKGLFTREIDRAVDEGVVDIAVHSLKDVPVLLPARQDILAYPKRADPRDGLLTNSRFKSLSELPEGAVLGTASLRREAQALALRPDLKVIPFRGSVETRIRKLKDGLADATFLAMAGLERLELGDVATPVPMDEMLPAASQGIISVAGRKAAISPLLTKSLSAIDDAATRRAATAERALLKELDGSCRTAIAAHMSLSSQGWTLRAEVLAPDGQQKWAAQATALLNADYPELAALGRDLGQRIRADAGGSLPAYVDS